MDLKDLNNLNLKDLEKLTGGIYGMNIGTQKNIIQSDLWLWRN